MMMLAHHPSIPQEEETENAKSSLIIQKAEDKPGINKTLSSNKKKTKEIRGFFL